QSTGGALRPGGYVPTPVWSNAGSIALGGNHGLRFDGTLLATAGAAQADGGTLTLSAAQSTSASNNTIVASGIILQQSGTLAAGLTPGAPIGTSSTAGGVEIFAIDRLNNSGIDTLIVGGAPFAMGDNSPAGLSKSGPSTATPPIGFAGNVSINLGRAFIAD